MWSVAAASEDTIVVSEIGEAWSPKMPPASEAARNGASGSPSAAAAGTAIGIMMANVPHEVPVENATNAPVRNTSGSRSAGPTPASATPLAT